MRKRKSLLVNFTVLSDTFGSFVSFQNDCAERYHRHYHVPGRQLDVVLHLKAASASSITKTIVQRRSVRALLLPTARLAESKQIAVDEKTVFAPKPRPNIV